MDIDPLGGPSSLAYRRCKCGSGCSRRRAQRERCQSQPRRRVRVRHDPLSANSVEEFLLFSMRDLGQLARGRRSEGSLRARSTCGVRRTAAATYTRFYTAIPSRGVSSVRAFRCLAYLAYTREWQAVDCLIPRPGTLSADATRWNLLAAIATGTCPNAALPSRWDQ